MSCACALRAHPPPTTPPSLEGLLVNCLEIKKNGPEGPFIIRNEIDPNYLRGREIHQKRGPQAYGHNDRYR